MNYYYNWRYRGESKGNPAWKSGERRSGGRVGWPVVEAMDLVHL